jgi:hypothetical protein
MTNKQRSRRSIPIAAVKRLMLATYILVLPTTVQGCNLPVRSSNITGVTPMQSKVEQTKFMFADDETEDNAQKKLVETFPIGSDINKFVSTMKSMKDVTCSKNVTITSTNDQETTCQYFIPTDGAATYRWFISASNQHGKITEIYINKYFTPYYPPNIDYRRNTRNTK